MVAGTRSRAVLILIAGLAACSDLADPAATPEAAEILSDVGDRVPLSVVIPAFEQKLTASDGAAGDRFGVVTISGDVAVVGALGDDEGSGSAYVFERIGDEWTEVARLTASDGEAGDVFGRSVAISGDALLVGATGDDDNGSGAGAAYVFERVGAAWTQVAKLTAADGAPTDLFGMSIGLSGDVAIVGALGDDDAGEGSGSAYVFERIGGAWTQVAKLTATGAEPDDAFGRSVRVVGDVALVGAPGDDDNGAGAGAAYVFGRGAAGWTQVAKLTAAEGGPSDNLGVTLALSEQYALVGSPRTNAAYMFERGAAGWTQVARLTPDVAGAIFFGASLAVDSEHALVGTAANENRGSVYVFERAGGAWNQAAVLTAFDGEPGDGFGILVAINGDRVLVGALQDDADTGSVYAYGLHLDPASAGDALGDLLDALPAGAFKAGGHRSAFQSRLASIQQSIADGDAEAAISQLWNLRRHVDGCGSTADSNDWIVDCAAQLSVRDLIDTMITGLGG